MAPTALPVALVTAWASAAAAFVTGALRIFWNASPRLNWGIFQGTKILKLDGLPTTRPSPAVELVTNWPPAVDAVGPSCPAGAAASVVLSHPGGNSATLTLIWPV